MGSFIFDNRRNLSEYHYVRKAGAGDYWFDIRVNKLHDYIEQFGENFCIVLYGSNDFDDCYILPFGFVKDLFKDKFLYNSVRWMGSISGDLLQIRNSGTALSVSECYNAFELLGNEDETDALKNIGEPQNLYNVDSDVEIFHLKTHIVRFNEIYRNATPRKRISISNQIARPNAITDYLKKIQNYTCQICGELGFLQINGVRYIEAHHIIELHKFIPGSYCSDNVIVVCANCHKKLHYARVEYISVSENQIIVNIKGNQFRFLRNVISL